MTARVFLGLMAGLAAAAPLGAGGQAQSTLSGQVLADPGASAEELLRQARALLEQENLKSARALLLEAKQADPKHVAVRYELGVTLFRLGDRGSAKQEFHWVVKQAPPAFYSHYFLGRIALAENHPQEAIGWLEPVVASGEPVLDASAQLGKAYLQAGELERALATLKAALREAPWDSSRHYLLGRVYRELDETELAREAFSTSEKLKNADHHAVRKLQECAKYLRQNEQQQARAIGRELLRDERLDPDVLVALALLFANSGLPAEALEPFQTAAQRDPDFFQAQYNSGLTLLKLGRPEQAEPPLRKAVELLPRSFDANSALALAHIMRGQHEDAIAPLEAARRAQPGNARIAGLLGSAYLRAGSPQKAVSVLRQAREQAPQDSRLHFLLIESLQGAQDYQAALTEADQALRLFPDQPQGYLAKAQELLRLGNYQQAGPLFEKVSDLDPGNLPALLGLGEVLQKKGDNERSLVVYQRALRQDPKNITAHLGVGKNLFLLRRFAEAKDALELALPDYPDNPQLRFELARVYARLGDAKRAAEQSRIFRELDTAKTGSAAAAMPAPAQQRAAPNR